MKAEAEEAARVKAEAEEAAQLKAAEEEAARVKAEAEEAARLKAEEAAEIASAIRLRAQSRRAWRKWASCVRHHCIENVKLASIANGWRMWKLLEACRHWQQRLASTRTETSTMMHSEVFWTQIRLRATWKQWAKVAAEAAGARRMLCTSIPRWQNSSVNAALLNWRSMCALAKAEQQRVQQIMAKSILGSVAVMFQEWLVLAAQRRVAQISMGAGVSAWLSHALRSWRMHTMALSVQKHSLLEQTVKWMHGSLLAAIRTWYATLQAKHFLQKLLLTAETNWERKQMSRFWQKWRSLSVESSFQSDVLFGGAVRRGKTRLTSACGAWRLQAAECAMRRQCMAAALCTAQQKLRNQMRLSWHAWRSRFNADSQDNRITDQSIQIQLSNMRRGCWNTLRLAAAEALMQQCMIQNSSDRWERARLCATWCTWCIFNVEMRMRKRRARRGLHQWLHARLNATMRLWRGVTSSEGILESIIEGKRIAILNLKRMRAMFETWNLFALQTAEQNCKASKVLIRMANRVKVAGFETWRDEAANLKATKWLISKAVKRMLNAKLAAAFSTWNATALRAAEQKRVRKAVMHLTNSSLLCAFRKLQSYACEKAVQKLASW